MTMWTDLVGTLNDYLRVGLTGPRLKSATGNLAVRNAGDTADAELTTSKVNVSGPDIVLDSDGNALTVSGNSAQSGALQIIFPPAKAADGQTLAQKAGSGAGVIEFEFVSAGNTALADKVDTTSLAFGDSSPVAMFTTGAADVIEYFDIVADTAFDGTPSLSIGISGQTSKYVASTKVDLTSPAGTTFRIFNSLDAQGAEALIATYVAGGATQGAARILVHYSQPA